MTGRLLAIVRRIFAAGPNGWGYDGLLLAGPVVLFVIAILGRTVITEVLAATYVGLFIIAFIYNGIR